MNQRIPEYVCKQTASRALDMSDDTFDKYVREGVLPGPKRRGKLVRWKWSEIVAALDGGGAARVEVVKDAFERGVALAKATNTRAS